MLVHINFNINSNDIEINLPRERFVLQAKSLNLFVTHISDYHPVINFKSSRGVKTGWSNRDRANDYNPWYAFVLL